MTRFIWNMVTWLLIGFCLVILGLGFYRLLKFYATQNAALLLQTQREDLHRKTEDVKAQQRNIAEYANRAKEENDAFYASVIKRQEEVELAMQKATETRMNAEKIKEAADIKLQQLQKENKKLQGDLIAARQRAKRLAKKSESGA